MPIWRPVAYLIQFLLNCNTFFGFSPSAVISHIYHSHSNPPPLPIFTFPPSYFRIREMCFRSRGDDVGRGRVRSGVSIQRRAMRAATPPSIPSHPLFPKSTQAFGSSVKSASLTVVRIFPFIRFGRDTKLCDFGSASALRLQHPTFPPSSPSLRI